MRRSSFTPQPFQVRRHGDDHLKFGRSNVTAGKFIQDNLFMITIITSDEKEIKGRTYLTGGDQEKRRSKRE